MLICNIPFNAAENTRFCLLASYLPAYNLVVLPQLVCVLADGADFLLVMIVYRRSGGHTKRYTSSSEFGVTEKMLRELVKHTEEMEAGGNNVTGM
jgi:hypothetical protein